MHNVVLFFTISLSIFIGSCSLFDYQHPSINIISPEHESNVQSVVIVKGSASDNIAVKSVKVSVDAGEYRTVDGLNEWGILLNLGAIGGHVITAKAEDYNGNIAIEDITVNVE